MYDNSVSKSHQFKEGHVKYSEINLEREIKAIKLERSLVKYLSAVFGLLYCVNLLENYWSLGGVRSIMMVLQNYVLELFLPFDDPLVVDLVICTISCVASNILRKKLNKNEIMSERTLCTYIRSGYIEINKNFNSQK